MLDRVSIGKVSCQMKNYIEPVFKHIIEGFIVCDIQIITTKRRVVRKVCSVSRTEVVDDTDLSASWGLDLEAVPTLLRFEGGREVGRTTGWLRDAWEDLSGKTGLGPELPAFKPG